MQQQQQRRGYLEQARRDRGVRLGVRSTGAAAVVMVAVAGGVVAGGVAAAPPLPDISPRPGGIKSGLFADSSRALQTREGYVIRAWKYGEALRSVIPLGRALNSYEAFLSLAGQASVSVADPKHPPAAKVPGATITVGVTLACAATPQSMQISGTVSNAVNASVTPSVSATVGGTAGGSGGSNGGQGNGAVNGSITPAVSATVGDTVTTSGTLSGTIAPGTSKDFPIATKTLTGKTGYVDTRETRISMDSCLGGAQVRSYATATLSTSEGDSSITTYGKPLFIKRDDPDPASMPPTVTQDRKPASAPEVAGTAVSDPSNTAPAPRPGAKPAPKPAPKAAPKHAPKQAPKPAPASKPAAPAPKPAA